MSADAIIAQLLFIALAALLSAWASAKFTAEKVRAERAFDRSAGWYERAVGTLLESARTCRRVADAVEGGDDSVTERLVPNFNKAMIDLSEVAAQIGMCAPVEVVAKFRLVTKTVEQLGQVMRDQTRPPDVGIQGMKLLAQLLHAMSINLTNDYRRLMKLEPLKPIRRVTAPKQIATIQQWIASLPPRAE